VLAWRPRRSSMTEGRLEALLLLQCHSEHCPMPDDVLSAPEMGDRFVTIGIGRKLMRLCPFSLGRALGPHVTQCGLGRGVPLYQVASWSIQPFGYDRDLQKNAPSFLEGEMGLHLPQCGLGRDLPPYQVASWSIQPFGHNTPTLQTYRSGQTDSQDR